MDEPYFYKSYPHNPVNLFTQSGRCDSPQPRYKKHPKFREVDTKDLYPFYYQCLPGCVVRSENNTAKKATSIWNSAAEANTTIVSFLNHSKCEAYDSPSKKSLKNNLASFISYHYHILVDSADYFSRLLQDSLSV